MLTIWYLGDFFLLPPDPPQKRSHLGHRKSTWSLPSIRTDPRPSVPSVPLGPRRPLGLRHSSKNQMGKDIGPKCPSLTPPPRAARGRIPGPLSSHPQCKHSAFVPRTQGEGQGGDLGLPPLPQPGPQSCPTGSVAPPGGPANPQPGAQLSLRVSRDREGSNPTDAQCVRGLKRGGCPGGAPRPHPYPARAAGPGPRDSLPGPRGGRGTRAGPGGDFLLPRAGLPTPALFATHS